MKSYARSRFEIINNTSIAEIPTETISTTIPLMMTPYTSDKGSEDWEVIRDLTSFTKCKGGLNFTKHGQAQFLVANLLRNGAYVLGKRMVSNDAKLAHTTIKAKVVQVDTKSFIYFYAVATPLTTGDNNEVTGGGAGTFKDAYTDGYGEFDSTAEPTSSQVTISEAAKTALGVESTTVDVLTYDIPIFTVTALGRGVSSLSIRLIPEYYVSKSSTYMKYTFEVSENLQVLNSILCTFNPDAIVDNVIQSIQNKVNTLSDQVKVKLFEDGVLKLTQVVGATATMNGNKIPLSELINLDYINGKNKKENAIGGVVTKANTIASTSGSDAATTNKTLWDAFKPSDISNPLSLDLAEGIPLVSGYNGTMGSAPVQNTKEYETMLLSAFGKGSNYPGDKNGNYDPIIYDLDRYKVDAIFDCGYPLSVKNAIVNLVDVRQDCVFFADLVTPAAGDANGSNYVAMPSNTDNIVEKADLITRSMFTAIYHNYFDIIDDFTKKQITVTMPYLLAVRMVNHIVNGVGRPFAGINNKLYFPEIIVDTINYKPVVVPGCDQKQLLADHCVNYLSYYNEVPVMDSLWVCDEEYTQMSFLHNVMGVQEIIKVIRDRCPRTRYTFLDGDDLDVYLDDCNSIIKEYKTNFKSISMEYMKDEKYESNNIFYAVIKVQFRNFVQEEYFKVIAID